MTIRHYKPEYRDKCIEIFKSNCPKYFADHELEQFKKWLDHQADPSAPYSSPTYNNAEKDEYFVVDDPKDGIIACGGFYVLKDKKEARMAWGMVQAGFHDNGIGTALFKHRVNAIKKDWPQHKITLCTSQHTYQFFENMGMKTLSVEKNGFGGNLDKYEMEYK